MLDILVPTNCDVSEACGIIPTRLALCGDHNTCKVHKEKQIQLSCESEKRASERECGFTYQSDKAFKATAFKTETLAPSTAVGDLSFMFRCKLQYPITVALTGINCGHSEQTWPRTKASFTKYHGTRGSQLKHTCKRTLTPANIIEPPYM